MNHSTRKRAPGETLALDDLPDDAIELAIPYLSWLRAVGRPWYVRPGSEQYFIALDLKACGLATVVIDDELPCFKVELLRRVAR